MYKHGVELNKNLAGLWKRMHRLKVFLILFYITSDITDLGFVSWVLFLICVLLIKYFTLGEFGWPFKLDRDELVQQSQVLSGNEKEDDGQTLLFLLSESFIFLSRPSDENLWPKQGRHSGLERLGQVIVAKWSFQYLGNCFSDPGAHKYLLVSQSGSWLWRKISSCSSGLMYVRSIRPF